MITQMDIATTLLEYGAKANAESKAGFTPLHLSAQEGHTDMSTLLIEHKADTNHKAKVCVPERHNCLTYDALLRVSRRQSCTRFQLSFFFSEWAYAASLMRTRR